MSSAPTVSKEYGAHDLDELKSICLTTPFIDAISATSMLVLDYFRVLGLKTAYDAFVKEAAIEDGTSLLSTWNSRSSALLDAFPTDNSV